MPLYLFQNPDNLEVKEIFFHMNDEKRYQENGILWKRIYTKPQMMIDAIVDPFSAKDFIKATGKGKGTIGELMDRSKELSEKRKEKEGIDPVKEKIYDEYKKKTGKDHVEKKKEIAKEKVKHIADIEF